MSRSREVASASFGRRNLIINGAMQVAQRGTQVTGLTSSGYRTCDRFNVAINTLGTWTSEQSTDAPADFKYSHKLTCTTADSSPAVNDYVFINQHIEGQNLAHLNYGSSDAKELTLSFWVKSNKTGTIGQEIQTSTSYERTVDVTINAENTWEYKTVSIPANTLYSIAEDNSRGLTVFWWINAGSTYKGTPTSTWGTNNSGRGGTLTSNIGSAVNDYIAITGVQLEVGSASTPFEHRSYGEELALCQRYFYRWGYTDASGSAGTIPLQCYATSPGGVDAWQGHPVEMRARPSITTNGSWSSSNVTSFSGRFQNRQGFSARYEVSVAGNTFLYANSSDDYFDIDAEF